jgi:hypothetical protein
MTSLALPVPELAWTPPGGAPQIEQPVELKLPAIVFPDGIEATESDAQKVGALVYRLGAGSEEIWNETEQAWTEPPADPAALSPVALSYKAGDPFPWQGMLVAVGMKDKDGNDRFEVASGGAPRYRLRTCALFKRDGAEFSGLSGPSAELAFVEGLQSQRFKVTMDPDDVQQAQEVTIALKNASLADAGYLKISTRSGQQVEIANCDASGVKLASVLLAADGTIHLKPAAGKKIVLEGDLEAQRIRYQPSGGGAATDL